MVECVNFGALRNKMSPDDYLDYLEKRLLRTCKVNREISELNELLSEALRKVDNDAYAEVVSQ